MQSADVFPAGRRLESLLVRETDAETGGLAPLFAATETRIDQAFARLDRVERRLQRLEATAVDAPARELAYVLYLASPAGYRLATVFGRLPLAGDQIVEDDATAEVLRVGASPLPGDRRPCVFAVATALPSRDAGEAPAAPARRAA
jgi:hypothetical protein